MSEPTRDALQDLVELAAEEPYLEDGGFTRRVVAQLPAPRAGRRYRLVILLGLGLLGLLIALVLFPGAEHLEVSATELLRYRPSSTDFPIAALVIIGAAAASLGLLAAWSESG